MFDELLGLVTSFFALGGPVVMILVALSVVAVAVILMKLFQFWQERVGNGKPVEEAIALYRSGRAKHAIDHLETRAGLAAGAVAMAMRDASQRRLGKQQIEERVSTYAAGRLHDLQGGFRVLDAISQISPLLGLFGTVLGMIEAFRRLQEAGNSVDPSILAGGIWVALLTTAVGLAVAMPVSLMLTWFESRLEDERVIVETGVGRLLNAQDEAFAESEPTGIALDVAHAH